MFSDFGCQNFPFYTEESLFQTFETFLVYFLKGR
jgi:hypothetical protein